MTLRRTFLWTMIVSLSLAAVLGVAAILVPGFGTLQEQILASALLVGGFSLPALGCSVALGRRRAVAVMWLGIAAAIAALAVWLGLVWAERWILGDVWLKLGLTLTTASLWAAHLGLLILLTLDREAFRWIRIGTLGGAAMLAGCLMLVIWPEFDGEAIAKALAILAILTGCGTVVTPILAILDVLARRGSRESLQQKITLRLACPRCGVEQVVAAGRSRCGACGLRIEIDVEEPRCACGYLLYHLQSANCPECGRSVSPDDCWATAAMPAAPASAPAHL